jgi:hypothetical protein
MINNFDADNDNENERMFELICKYFDVEHVCETWSDNWIRYSPPVDTVTCISPLATLPSLSLAIAVLMVN